MKITIIGAGTMGSALVGGLFEDGSDELRVSSRRADSLSQLLEAYPGVPTATSNREAVRDADLVVLAVKPKHIRGVCADLRGHLSRATCVVSIAAGIRIEAMQQELGPDQPCIRAMPNTPCLIRSGMTVLSPAATASEEHIAGVARIFRSLGRVLVLDEEHMDSVTGLSGSGPAFVYVIIEALAEGGVMRGLPRKVATELAAQTVLGAARMVMETGRHPADLKDAVTTPAGCTISALMTLEDGRLRSVLARGVEEAARAASRLSGD